MRAFEAKLTSRDGTDFFVRGWEPDSPPRAVIALVHGLGEHIGRYPHVAQALTGAGYVLVGFDQRGHGRSGGRRGHMASLDVAMQDIQRFLASLAERYPEKLPFLYGHSMGGLLVLTYALRQKHHLRGVISSSPGLRSQLHEQKGKVLLAKVLGSLIPSMLIPSELDLAGISHDPHVISDYNDDPLVHDRISLGLGKGLLLASEYVWKHADEFSLPLLLMHGAADPVTYAHGSRDFAAQASKNNRDVTVKIWDGLYHEIHNEPQQAEVFRFVIDWLDRHI